MSGPGHRDGRVSNKHRKEHLISTLLHERGISRKGSRLRLGIKSPQYYSKCMTNPADELSYNQLHIIAELLELPLPKVLGMIAGMKPSAAHKWYKDYAGELP